LPAPATPPPRIKPIRSAAADAYAGSFSNRNMYACFAELSLPVVLWLGIRDGRPRWYWLVNAAALHPSVINTGSRAGAILILVECVAFALLVGRGRHAPRNLAHAWPSSPSSSPVLGGHAVANRMTIQRPLCIAGTCTNPDSPCSPRDRWPASLGAFPAAYPAYARSTTAAS
jgi:hypothetical protein